MRAAAVVVAAIALSSCVRHTYTRPAVTSSPTGDVAWIVEDDARIVRCVDVAGSGPICVRADVRDR